MFVGRRSVNSAAKSLSVIVDNGSVVEWIDRRKHLGVIIDYNLKFLELVDYISKKTARKVGVMYRVRNAFLSIDPLFCYCPMSLIMLDWKFLLIKVL